MITLGDDKSDNINRMIILTNRFLLLVLLGEFVTLHTEANRQVKHWFFNLTTVINNQNTLIIISYNLIISKFHSNNSTKIQLITIKMVLYLKN